LNLPGGKSLDRAVFLGRTAPGSRSGTIREENRTAVFDGTIRIDRVSVDAWRGVRLRKVSEACIGTSQRVGTSREIDLVRRVS
jgi:hypothetical protein